MNLLARGDERSSSCKAPRRCDGGANETYPYVLQFLLGDLELLHQFRHRDSTGRLACQINYAIGVLQPFRLLPLGVHVQIHLVGFAFLLLELRVELFQLLLKLPDALLGLKWVERYFK